MMKKKRSHFLLVALTLCLSTTLFADSDLQATLRGAIDSQNAESIDVLLTNNKNTVADSDSLNLGSLLRRAARKGCAACVDILIEWNAPVDERGPTQDTATYWAVKKGHVDTVERLLQADANPNGKCALGHSLLYWADQKLCEAMDHFEESADTADLLKIEDFEAIANLLLEYGAKDHDETIAPAIGSFGNNPGELFGKPTFEIYT